MKNKVSKNSSRSIGHARITGGIKARVPKGFLPCSLIGALIAIAISAVLAIVFSYILYKTADPTRYLTPVALSVLYVSALLGGFIAVRFNSGSALLCGLVTGVLLIAITFIFSLLVKQSLSSDHSAMDAIALRATIPVCSIIGAFIGNSKPSSDKKRRKNHKKRQKI
jgi:putative membrane protein (TIGR04086 family)